MKTRSPKNLEINNAGSDSAQTCEHSAAGAVEFSAGQWKCRDCGQKLQIAAVSSVWEIFGQISRCAAYCAILAACVPMFLALISKQDLRKPVSTTAITAVNDDLEDDIESPVPKWISRAKA